MALCIDEEGQEGDDDDDDDDEELADEDEAPMIVDSGSCDGTDGFAVGLLTTGGVSLGVAVGFFVASTSSNDAAAGAGTYEASLSLHDQAKSQRTISIAAGATGVALLSYGLYRIFTGPEDSERTQLSITGGPEQAGVAFTGRF